MTERDYIVVSELKAIRIAQSILTYICFVDDSELKTVHRFLRGWESKYEKELNVDTADK